MTMLAPPKKRRSNKAMAQSEPSELAKQSTLLEEAIHNSEPCLAAQEAMKISEPSSKAKTKLMSEPSNVVFTSQDYNNVEVKSSYRLLADGYLGTQKEKVANKAKLRKTIENLQVEKGYATKTKSVDKFGHNIETFELIPERKEEAEQYAAFLQQNDPAMRAFNEIIRRQEKEEIIIKKEAIEIIKDHPIWLWIQNTRGLSEVAALTYMGYIHPLKATSIGKMWAYCGLVPGKSLKRGERGNFNPQVKARMWLQAKNVIMAKDPYYYPMYVAYKERKTKEEEEKAMGQSEPFDLAKNHMAERTMSQSSIAKTRSEPFRRAKTKMHINNMAIRWLAKLLMAHAWEFIRAQAGQPINYHHDHIPPKPIDAENQRSQLQKFLNHDVEANKRRWAEIKANGISEPKVQAQEAIEASEPIEEANENHESERTKN